MVKDSKDACKREEILSMLREFAGKIVLVEESEMFVFEIPENRMKSFSTNEDHFLASKIKVYIEEGIIDWVIEENRPVVIDDYELVRETSESEKEKNIVLIPLQLSNDKIGMYALSTMKRKEDFTNRDLTKFAAFAEKGAKAIRKIGL